MRILITGSSGFIGQALMVFLCSKGHEVFGLVRREVEADPKKGLFFWNPEKGMIDPASLENMDAVVNLAGDNIFEGRWTKSKKERILNSRTQAAKLLFSLKKRPPIWIQASAVGFYGDRKETLLDESSSKGEGFLADVCEKWEEPCLKASSQGIRSVVLRFGIVLAPGGGILKELIPLFKWGLGAKLSSGKQWMSWIALDDLLSLIEFSLRESHVQGIFNAVSLEPVTNAQFTKALGKTFSRPAWFSVPAWILRLIFGKEKTNQLLLSSAKVEPRALKHLKFSFRYPTLEKALDFTKLN